MFKNLTLTHRRYLKIIKKVFTPSKNFCNLKHPYLYPYLHPYDISIFIYLHHCSEVTIRQYSNVKS